MNLTQLIQAFMLQQATSNGASFNGQNATSFNITPTVLQKLVGRIQESDAFLKKINVIPVTLQQGRVLGLGIGNPIASRTDTLDGSKMRIPKKAHSLNVLNEYTCRQTNFDTLIHYRKMSS